MCCLFIFVIRFIYFVHFLYCISIADSYIRHPNSYLPRYNIQSETDGESAPLTGGGGISSNSAATTIRTTTPNKRRQATFKSPDIGPQQIIESDENPEDDDEDVPSYGFPAQQKRRNRRDTCDLDLLMGTGSEYFMGWMNLTVLHVVFLYVVWLSIKISMILIQNTFKSLHSFGQSLSDETVKVSWLSKCIWPHSILVVQIWYAMRWNQQYI